MSNVELRGLQIKRYKGFLDRVDVEFAPLTILIGPNNAGKTALARALQLLAGGLVSADANRREPLPLASGGVVHGAGFEDLVTNRSPHRALAMALDLTDSDRKLSLSTKVRNVISDESPPERQILRWRLKVDQSEITMDRLDVNVPSVYRVSESGQTTEEQPIVWRGLVPAQPNKLPAWLPARTRALQDWASGVRYLRCPRKLRRNLFRTPEYPPQTYRADGRDAPLALAADDELRESVRRWYRDALGVRLDIRAHGLYSELFVGAPLADSRIALAQSGQGLSHVLPVAVTALTASQCGPGAEIIEHPEAELHPRVHAHVADLLLSNLPGPQRPVIVETHSEMLLLRTRRWIAEGRMPSNDALVYWITSQPGRGSTVEQIRFTDSGDMDSWPKDVFVDDYKEVLAIRRAARTRK